MKHHLNTLFISADGSHLSKRNDTVLIKSDDNPNKQIPFCSLDSIICFGEVHCTPRLLGACMKRGINITYLSVYGRYIASVVGLKSGNVLVRREQYRKADDKDFAVKVSRQFIIGKLSNYVNTLKLFGSFKQVEKISKSIERLNYVTDLNMIRGIEGDASASYFSTFDDIISADDDRLKFNVRSRRPPKNIVNCILSFLYIVLSNDTYSACESVGLDSAVGYLHSDRSGRLSLSLDLMEELRSILVDRVVCDLIIGNEINPDNFIVSQGGVSMDAKAKKIVLGAYQSNKNFAVYHPFLDERVTLGHVACVQSKILVKTIIGELDDYKPFVLEQ